MNYKLMKNKKANAWINVLVILVLATCLAAGYSFLTTSGKISAEISGVGVLNEVYLDEGSFQFYVDEAGKKAVEKTYAELGEDEILLPDNFFTNFQKEFEVYGLNKEYLKKENFVIDNSKNILKVKIDNWQIRKNFKTEKTDVEVLYRPELNFEFELK